LLPTSLQVLVHNSQTKAPTKSIVAPVL